MGTIYASNENGNLYKSTDGITFIPMCATEGLIYTLTFDSKNKIIYAGSKIDDSKGILYKSTNVINFKKLKKLKKQFIVWL